MVVAVATLALVIDNDGPVVVTVHRTHLDPPEAPFVVESMGYGPFWIRPERARELHVTFAPATIGNQTATLTIHSEAPPVSVNLVGN